MDAPAHTQFAATKDLRSQGREFDRDANQVNKWKNGARTGPGRDANDETHKTPAGPHPIYPRQRGSQQGHARRKSSALVGGIDLDEELDLAHGDEIVPTSPGAVAGKIATLSVRDQEYDEEDYDDEDGFDSQAPPVPGAENAYSDVIDRELEEANKRADDRDYLLVVDGEAVPSDPAELKAHKRAQAAEYVVVKQGDAKEEKE